ncbi:hypothetical protein [Streptomyces sp. VRA16 Mangrove soil]|uniref:glycoside hydrolase family 38 N-terminal domain-containing protein n=1 Tax=Streptomyces sp. VRA16 Mangrove soil TaxID=2817434 RepID=UPI001A9FCACB|nr:hypothetical protein [Streptomyces sp. VRA16 Mangrove soil]MBO1332302.1 hypothetical protein [Streptomyces sp. VRA16 Mangrove soil]
MTTSATSAPQTSAAPETSAAPDDRAMRAVGTTAVDAAVCHVVTHVHWDREWYRPFEAFRARLVELAARVCDELDDGRMDTFHLDGQTIVLADVAALRPDLADRLRAHAAAGRLTVGPWHVLADNQLVSGENLIRNLLAARRHAPGTPAGVGYSPDAFGHPADLPRLLNGFGMDTALVWRGAPEGVARFRWRSPDGSEVFAVNQGYHGAEVLWGDDAEAAAERLAGFLATERDRLPGGPWLLMNGGDHLAPTDPARRLAEIAATDVVRATTVRHSTLEEFFTHARAAADPADLPLREGELRDPAGYLTFILPGTLSARTDLKQANIAAQNLLERWAEPLLALHAPDDATLRADLDHAWELLLRNAPHDSICGCSVDEVHRENAVRYERVTQLGDHVVTRALAAAGLDVRAYGDRCEDITHLVVVNPHGDTATDLVEVDLLTAPGRHPVEISTADGTPVAFEAETLGEETAFEADIDLLPDSRPSLRHRLRVAAPPVPGLGRRVLTVRLEALANQDTDTHLTAARDGVTQHGGPPAADALPGSDARSAPGGLPHAGSRPVPGGAAGTVALPGSGDTAALDGLPAPVQTSASVGITAPDGGRLTAAADASLTWHRADGTTLLGLGLLTDGGDAGDTYNYDPPVGDMTVRPRLVRVRARRSSVREVLEIDAVLDLPAGLTPDRTRRTRDTVAVPVRVTVSTRPGDPLLRWDVEIDNRARDHRLRLHLPTAHGADTWTGDGHWSLLERPVAADLGPLPDARGHEAVCGSAPVQSLGAVGRGVHRSALFAPGLPEMRALGGAETATGADQEIVVTLLRCVGWLSRFDLRSRTTGAGPMLATPDAQLPGVHRFRLAAAFGHAVADDTDLARLAAAYRTPLRAWQARPGTVPADADAAVRVEGALLTALKPAEPGGAGVDGGALILRLTNPTASPARARVHAPPGALLVPARLDESPTGEPAVRATAEPSVWPLAPYAAVTVRISR